MKYRIVMTVEVLDEKKLLDTAESRAFELAGDLYPGREEMEPEHGINLSLFTLPYEEWGLMLCEVAEIARRASEEQR